MYFSCIYDIAVTAESNSAVRYGTAQINTAGLYGNTAASIKAKRNVKLRTFMKMNLKTVR